MTLADILPSLACAEPELVFAGAPVGRLAARFGTPAHFIDEDAVRSRARAYREALPDAEVAFAGKALCTAGVLRWIAEEGLSLDTCSAGEIAMARSVGFPAERILLHGNAKTPEDFKAAIEYGVGRIVVDSLDEIAQLGPLARAGQQVMIRVTPDVAADTHAAISTGTEGQKFGFSLDRSVPENLDRAVAAVLAQPSLRLTGLHCHIGSQVSRVDRFELAARKMAATLAHVRETFGVTLRQLDLGGGHAVAYREGDPEFDLGGYARRIRIALAFECTRHGLPLPRLTIEPGRAIVASAGMTVYRVCSVKRGSRTFVAVDGGMSDNPRPALYGARYHARLVRGHTKASHVPMSVVGRHCESGDVLAENVPLPSDVHAGDLIAVPCTGAYHHSLGSNYNLVGRPPVVGVRAGTATVLVRRESEDDLLRRECPAGMPVEITA
ncbi:diaminopimelate decarboxylase [Amycolatopsis minnesotensis]|uniref:Diaminopimelate decarboxylase n=1 Tax=Amycolatopsis minnesotensis TaxID=337894 RepID=A0ABN2SV36_9PSEU